MIKIVEIENYQINADEILYIENKGENYIVTFKNAKFGRLIIPKPEVKG